MVNGFGGLEPGNLQPGPLVHALGTALRSSFVGFGIALVGSFTPRIPARFDSWLNLPDAMGLAFFSIVGAGIALEVDRFEVSPFIASLFGVITGTFGGVIGDIACNDMNQNRESEKKAKKEKKVK